MNYTEEDIRDAFKAGLTKGKHQSYFDAPLDEDEYIEELKRVKSNFVLADVSGRSEQLCPECGSNDIEAIVCGDLGCNNCGNIWA